MTSAPSELANVLSDPETIKLGVGIKRSFPFRSALARNERTNASLIFFFRFTSRQWNRGFNEGSEGSGDHLSRDRRAQGRVSE